MTEMEGFDDEFDDDDVDDEAFLRAIATAENSALGGVESKPECVDRPADGQPNPTCHVPATQDGRKECEGRCRCGDDDVSDDDDEARLFESTIKGIGRLPTPSRFPFPFPPYSIQEDFMRNLYKSLDEGKIGIFESPTGTGKSLSLVCGAVLWLKHFEKRRQEDIKGKVASLESRLAAIEADASLDWVAAHSRRHDLNQRLEIWRRARSKDELIAGRLAAIEGRLRRSEGGGGEDGAAPPKKRRRVAVGIDASLEKRQKEEKELFAELFPEGIPASEKGDWHQADCDGGGDDDDDDDLLVDVESGESGWIGKTDVDKLDNENNDDANHKDEEDVNVTKIIFCSRTHSQLSQFVGEVRKSPHGDAVRLVTLGSRQNLCVNERVNKLKSVRLINERCQELRDGSKKSKGKKGNESGCPYFKKESIELLSEEALSSVHDIEDLASVGRQRKACPYYASRAAVPLAQIVVVPYNLLLHKNTRQACGIDIRDQVVIVDEAHNLIDTISSVHSVEVTLSQLRCSQIQLSHYLTKFKKRLKPGNLLSVKQIIFILKSLIKTLTTTPRSDDEFSSLRLLTLFDFVYEAELDHQISSLPRLLKYMTDSQICRKLQGFAEKYSPTDLKESERRQAQEKKNKGGVGGLKTFLHQIHTAAKAKPKTANDAEAEGRRDATSSESPEGWLIKSPLMHVRGFLESLIMDNKDGRIVVKLSPIAGQGAPSSSSSVSSTSSSSSSSSSSASSEASLRFLLLNPSNVFTDVVRDARSLILAGGTMEPVEEVKSQLFYPNGVPEERIHQFSCGHVIHKENLLPMTLSKGPTGVDFEFTFKNRCDVNLINELGQLILNVSRVTPGGVVVFFPSYDYEKRVYSSWVQTGILARIAARKKIFREPRLSSQLDAVLSDYAETIALHSPHSQSPSSIDSVTTATPRSPSSAASSTLAPAKPSLCTGAVLLSVVGGKMSEGINFSDDLGRLVIMVGLPYPNKFSPELKEKMDFLDETMMGSSSASTSSPSSSPGQEHYENLCMKAVNQSIGRAIRHKNDFAAILLVDSRSSRPNVVKKLPNWIRDKLERKDNFAQAFSSLRTFFDAKKGQGAS